MRTSDGALAGRGHMVPLAAKLVVGDHDHRVLPAGAALNVFEQVDEVVAAPALARVPGMLILQPDRLDETYGIEGARLFGRLSQFDEGLLILKVSAARRAGRIGGVIVERLVMELENLVRAVRPRRIRC